MPRLHIEAEGEIISGRKLSVPASHTAIFPAMCSRRSEWSRKLSILPALNQVCITPSMPEHIRTQCTICNPMRAGRSTYSIAFNGGFPVRARRFQVQGAGAHQWQQCGTLVREAVEANVRATSLGMRREELTHCSMRNTTRSGRKCLRVSCALR